HGADVGPDDVVLVGGDAAADVLGLRTAPEGDGQFRRLSLPHGRTRRSSSLNWHVNWQNKSAERSFHFDFSREREVDREREKSPCRRNRNSMPLVPRVRHAVATCGCGPAPRKPGAAAKGCEYDHPSG